MFGFEKDSDAPPSYHAAQQHTLTTSSHGVTLSIPTPSTSSKAAFRPGDLVMGKLVIPESILGSMESGIKVRLEGKSSVEVMGKSRYQVCLLPSLALLFSLVCPFLCSFPCPCRRCRRCPVISPYRWSSPYGSV